MKRLSAVGGALFIIFLLFAFSGSINTGIKNLRTDAVTVVGEIVTGMGETSGNVTLTRELFQYNLINVTTVTSSDGDDDPIASEYDEDTKELTISGLAASTTRNITVTYSAPLDDDFWSAIGPFLGIFVFGGVIAAALYYAFKH